MDINNINTSSASAIRSSGAPAKRIEREGNSERDDQVRGPQKEGGQLFKALEKTLSQLGLAASETSRPPVATASQANDAETAASSSAQNSGQALPEFMNALFQALNPAGNPPPSGTSSQPAGEDGEETSTIRKKGAYDDLAGRLQNLVQSLGNDIASANTGTTDNRMASLETSFQNLAPALQGKVSPGASPNSAPDLQSFLKTLAQNLNSTGTVLDSAGNLVNTEA